MKCEIRTSNEEIRNAYLQERLTLNTQEDSIKAKLFIQLLVCSIFTPQFNITYS